MQALSQSDSTKISKGNMVFELIEQQKQRHRNYLSPLLGLHLVWK